MIGYTFALLLIDGDIGNVVLKCVEHDSRKRNYYSRLHVCTIKSDM